MHTSVLRIKYELPEGKNAHPSLQILLDNEPPSFLEALFVFLFLLPLLPATVVSVLSMQPQIAFSNQREVLFTFTHSIVTVNSFLVKAELQQFAGIPFSALSKCQQPM